VWKKTSFFTTGKHVDLFIDIQAHLEDMGIAPSVSDSVFKVKFDASPSQAQTIFAQYIQKISKTKEEMLTAA